MSSSTRGTHVLIVGAGLGGLALAQALRHKGISFDVFERDTSEVSRSQGWAVTLRGELIESLLYSTPADLPDLEPVGHLHEHGIPCEAAVLDASEEKLKEIRRFGPEHGDRMIRARRDKLRAWFLTGLKSVHWNKKFLSFDESDDGVTANFEDGTSYRGDVLVGADGVNSKVRDQLFRDDMRIRPKLVAFAGILGELTATREQYTRWMGTAKSYYTAVAGNLRMSVALKCLSADAETAEYYWLYGWKDDNAADEHHWTRTASREELHKFAMGRSGSVHSAFGEVMQATPVERMLYPPLRLQDMTPPELPHGRVTILGDACHPMLPFRGQGGNMAIMDGLNLGKIIGEIKGDLVAETLKRFEDEMRPRTEEMVLASRAAATATTATSH